MYIKCVVEIGLVKQKTELNVTFVVITCVRLPPGGLNTTHLFPNATFKCVLQKLITYSICKKYH